MKNKDNKRLNLSLRLISLALLFTMLFSGCAQPPQESTPTESTAVLDSFDSTVVEPVDEAELEQVPVSFFLADVNYLDVEKTIEMLKAAQINILTVPLAWTYLEPQKGTWTPEVYTAALDAFVDAGFHFVFVIDAGARRIINDNNEPVGFSIPDWVYKEAGFDSMVDFFGMKTADGRGSMSFSSASTRDLYVAFCEKTLDYFGERYSDVIVGFAPGIMSEFEIKYPQEGFRWNDYSDIAQESFRDYLKQTYTDISHMNNVLGTTYASFDQIEMPVVDYNNSIRSGSLVDSALYTEMQKFRTEELIEFLIPVYGAIHDHGFTTVSYFAQTLHSHDGIYNSGIAVKLADYVDIAVIDYNFYDGYDLVWNDALPAMLTNYLKTAGYDQVWSGIYLERMDYREHLDFIQSTINYCAYSGVCDGIEIGGIIGILNANPDATIPSFSTKVLKRTEDAKIAIYASEWNFYHAHGESQEYINYFTDSIVQMYKIIQFELERNVDIISDDIVLSDKLEQYDLVIAPSAFYVDTEVKEAIAAYIENGGKFLQDFRFGEWDAYCNNTGDWLDEKYGLTAREAIVANLETLYSLNDQYITVPDFVIWENYTDIANLYSVATDGTSDYLFRTKWGKKVGMINEDTICLGFQPQIEYKFAIYAAEREKYVQIIDQAIDYLIGS